MLAVGLIPSSLKYVSLMRGSLQNRHVPVNSLKAAGLSWSMEASISMGVLHF